MSYGKLIRFGATPVNNLAVYNNDPLTMCIGRNASQAFNHGSNGTVYGQNSAECQTFMAERCAKNWDEVCEYAASFPANEEFGIRADTMGYGMDTTVGMNSGDILLRNTAMKKYLVRMHGGNCELKTEPFDPINPSSPYISNYVGTGCVPEFAVDPRTIDNDPVMDKILEKPRIAFQMLKNIRNTMIRNGTFHLLRGTKLGDF